MKTTIVQLEPHDDVISIKDKISWCKSERIILVFPRKSRRIPEYLDLKLIQRCSSAQGADLAIVTHNARLGEIASSLGLQVFSSIPKAEKADWVIGLKKSIDQKPMRGFTEFQELKNDLEEFHASERTPNRAKYVNWLVAIASLLALSALAITIFPNATVKVYPLTKVQKLTMQVIASEDVDTVNISGAIPAVERLLRVSLSEVRNSTGTIYVPEGKARGKVEVVNLSDERIDLPAGTIFLSNGETPISFISLEQVSLVPTENAVIVEVEAVQPGSSGNIPENWIERIDNVYGELIKVTRSHSFGGGTSIQISSPTSADYNLLREELLKSLRSKAITQIENNLTDNENLIDGDVITSKIISENQKKPIGQPSDFAELEMTVEFSIPSYKKEDLYLLVNQVMDATLASGYKVVSVVPVINSLQDGQLNENGDPTWKIEATRKISKVINLDFIKSMIVGIRVEEAEKILDEKILQSKPAEVIPFIRFWKWMPFLEGQIKILEQY